VARIGVPAPLPVRRLVPYTAGPRPAVPHGRLLPLGGIELDRIRIATRKSPLALWQAHAIADALTAAHPGLECELVPMVTDGDRFLSAPLTEIGGKNTFIKELEQAMLDGRADIAVHSVKDVTAELPDGLVLTAFTKREDPRDAFVSNLIASFAQVPQGARIGTASSRRRCQLLEQRPDLEVNVVRGNVNSRLAKLDAGNYDALVLAAAGLKRLGFDDRVSNYFEPEDMLPAVGQGIMGIECAADADDVRALVATIAHAQTTAQVLSERAVNLALGGGCHMPIAAYAQTSSEGQLWLRALVGAVDGTQVLRAEASGPVDEPAQLGERVGAELLSLGASALINAQ
jgi:hydroxymethylbilane synthase